MSTLARRLLLSLEPAPGRASRRAVRSSLHPQGAGRRFHADRSRDPAPAADRGDLTDRGEFATAAANARSAGFDGVEIHGANGYLIDEFLHESSNRRTDGYGGSVSNRARFLFEVADAVIDVWGADRVGVRFSPHNSETGLSDSDPDVLYPYVLEQLDKLGLAYLHLIDPRASLATFSDDIDGDAQRKAVARYRQSYTGRVITAGGYTHATAIAALRSGHADAVAFGRHFVANPDLVERLRTGAPLNPYDRSTFYTPGARGYTDYPALTYSRTTSAGFLSGRSPRQLG